MASDSVQTMAKVGLGIAFLIIFGVGGYFFYDMMLQPSPQTQQSLDDRDSFGDLDSFLQESQSGIVQDNESGSDSGSSLSGDTTVLSGSLIRKGLLYKEGDVVSNDHNDSDVQTSGSVDNFFSGTVDDTITNTGDIMSGAYRDSKSFSGSETIGLSGSGHSLSGQQFPFEEEFLLNHYRQWKRDTGK